MNRFVAIALAAGSALAAPRLIPEAPSAPPYVYEPMAAQFVAGPDASKPEWSPSGRYIAFRLNAPDAADAEPPPARVVLWSRRTRRAAVDWTAPWPKSDVTQQVWLPGSDMLLLGVTDDRTEIAGGIVNRGNMHILQMDPRKGAAAEIASVWMGPSTYLIVSPRGPYAVAFSGGEDVSKAVIIGPNGASNPIDLPTGEYNGAWRWSANGAALAAEYHPYAKSPEDKPASVWVELDARTATLKLNVPKPTAVAEPEPPVPPFGVPEVRARYTGPFGAQPVHPLWLVETGGAGPEHFLLHPDGHSAVISPRWDGVCYLSDGMLFVRPLVRTPRTEYMQRKAAAARKAASENARQIGVALRMYSDDYDNQYPLPGDDMKVRVGPYIRDPDIWDAVGGFHYAFAGGSLKGADPAVTEIGYYDVPGGRVIAYGDGHAAFVAGG
ncbi:MAG TPA: hypothetical protein VGM37_15240 [Armatimonadota bacterium]